MVVAHEVATGDVAVDPAGRADAVRRAGKVRATGDQRPRDDPGADDLALVVDVGDELVERTDPLCEPALDFTPLLCRDDPWHEVERKWSVGSSAFGAAQVEGDSLTHEERVAQLSCRDEALAAQPRKLGDELLAVFARRARRGKDLVVAIDQRAGGAHPHIVRQAGTLMGASVDNEHARRLYLVAARARSA